MADWASLINLPPPSEVPVICESDGVLLTSNDLRGQAKVSEILSQIPEIDLALQDPKIGHKLQAADTTFLSAKSAFLPADEKLVKKTSTASSIILNSNGIFDNFIANNEETWWFRLLSSLLSFGNPHLKMNSDDLIALYSNTRDLKGAPVRCLSWHPHVPKVAVAMKDDSIQIALTSSGIKPLLKHKKQKQVRLRFELCI